MADDLDRLFERLVSERGYASLEPAEVQDALRREVAESNPDAALFRQFPDAMMSLNRLAAERSLRGDRAYAPPPPPPLAPPPESADAPEREQDPHEKNFCPQCGQPPSGELRCPACGGEVDVGWRYCVSCGRATGFE